MSSKIDKYFENEFYFIRKSQNGDSQNYINRWNINLWKIKSVEHENSTGPSWTSKIAKKPPILKGTQDHKIGISKNR